MLGVFVLYLHTLFYTSFPLKNEEPFEVPCKLLDTSLVLSAEEFTTKCILSNFDATCGRYKVQVYINYPLGPECYLPNFVGDFYVHWPLNGKCHKLYQRGPCAFKEHLTLDQNAEPRCQNRRACPTLRRILKGSSSLRHKDDYQVICEEGVFLIVNGTFDQPICWDSLIQPAKVTVCPPGSVKDSQKGCVPVKIIGDIKCPEGTYYDEGEENCV